MTELKMVRGDRVACLRFVPNAPEQNPVEDIWLLGKNLMRKFAYRCKSLAIVKRLFMFFLNRQIFGFPKNYMYGSVHNSCKDCYMYALSTFVQ